MNKDINSLISDSIKTFQNGNFIEAKYLFLSILDHQPKNFDILYNIAVIFLIEKNYNQAFNYFKKAININPNNYLVNSNLALTLSKLGNDIEAIKYYSIAVKLKSDYPIAWFNFAKTLSNLKKYNEALSYYDEAIKLNPEYAEAWSNKGVTLYDLKYYNEALSHFDQAIKLKPNYFQIWFNKALTLNQLKRYKEALSHYDEAIKLNPEYAEAWSNKGLTLEELKLYDEALSHYDKANCLNSDINFNFGQYLHLKMKICDWFLLNQHINNCINKINSQKMVSQPFPILTLIDDPNIHLKCSKIFIKNQFSVNFDLKFKPKSKKKIKIGYFSADFRDHPVSLLTAELFDLHDRNKFEIIAFSFGVNDQSETRLKLIESFDTFIDVKDKSDLDIAKLARKLDIDIAIDLMGFTKGARTQIFFYRVAPIQVNWLGYPGTLGAKFIDYIIADKIVIPKSSLKFYTEKVIYLPHTFMVDDSRRVASPRIFTKQECGLPKNSFVFCCFNSDYKFNEQILESWSKILTKVDKSVLWLSDYNEKFKRNFKIELEKKGINSKRVIFSKREKLNDDYLARYSLADLFLDTFPYNAHATAIDSLKAGVPVITIKGKSFASRVGASLLNAIGLPELITSSYFEYENLIIELATNNKKLRFIKNKLFENRFKMPLFNTVLFVRNLEVAYIKIHKNYQLNLKPKHLKV